MSCHAPEEHWNTCALGLTLNHVLKNQTYTLSTLHQFCDQALEKVSIILSILHPYILYIFSYFLILMNSQLFIIFNKWQLFPLQHILLFPFIACLSDLQTALAIYIVKLHFI